MQFHTQTNLASTQHAKLSNFLALEQAKLSTASAILTTTACPLRTTQQLQQLMRAFVHALLSAPDAGPRTLLLAREQIQPTAAFASAHRTLFEPLHSTLAACVACLRGSEPSSAETVLRTHALLGQAIVFAVSHGALQARLNQGAPLADVETIGSVVSGMALAAAKAAPA